MHLGVSECIFSQFNEPIKRFLIHPCSGRMRTPISQKSSLINVSSMLPFVRRNRSTGLNVQLIECFKVAFALSCSKRLCVESEFTQRCSIPVAGKTPHSSQQRSHPVRKCQASTKMISLSPIPYPFRRLLRRLKDD